MKTKQNIAIFASYNGSNLDPIYKACINNDLNISISTIITNNSDAKVINKAKKLNIPYHIINDKNTKDIDKKIIEVLEATDCNMIVLAGYMKKLSATITQKYKIINSHPSLLPKYGGAGMYGKFVHHAVINNKEEYSGITIHYVNDKYDDGEIILQKKLKLKENETAQSLEEKIKELESKTIVKALQVCLK